MTRKTLELASIVIVALVLSVLLVWAGTYVMEFFLWLMNYIGRTYYTLMMTGMVILSVLILRKDER
jgi:hypothetical protein